jgi:hypothetical protein
MSYPDPADPGFPGGFYMEMHKAMKEAAGEQNTSIIADIAERINLKPSVVYKWTRPSEDPGDSGQRGPGNTLMQFMEACLILGRPREAALSPLKLLNLRFDQIVFSIPDHIKHMAPDNLARELIRCMKETGDVVREYEAAMADNRISKDDRTKLEREILEAVTELLILLHAIQHAVK